MICDNPVFGMSIQFNKASDLAFYVTVNLVFHIHVLCTVLFKCNREVGKKCGMVTKSHGYIFSFWEAVEMCPLCQSIKYCCLKIYSDFFFSELDFCFTFFTFKK